MRHIIMRSLLVAAIVICDCISWTASRHHYEHNASGHRNRHRRQGARLYLPGSYVIPGGEGNGAWGGWGEPTSCSRSCGGGVAYQERICLDIDQAGRARCEGGVRKYFSCNTQDCPDGSVDFRSEQCAAFNDIPIKNVTYDWVPYTDAPKQCALNCMPRRERFYYRHREKVVDGTPCNSESLDVCVDGTCQPVGCDMMLGSQAKEDKCRECRGNGTSCKTITGINEDQNLKQGYNDILLIPAGSTNIDIAEIRPSNNYLAIRSAKDRKYYLNGEYRIDFPRHLLFAGSVWIYERNPQGFAAPDIVRCQGPTTEPVYLSLLILDENVGVRYEYSVPTSMVPLPDQQYGWVYEPFTPCSATCGGGHQTRNVTCRSRQKLDPVEDSLCDQQLRPPSNQTCASIACAPRWVERPWGPCSQPCGEGGSQSREVHCEKVIAHGLPSMVSDDECFSNLGPKPDLHRRCNVGGNCPSWHIGPWKPCNKLCGEGKMTREVTCFLRTEDGRVDKRPDADCSEEKPLTQQECLLQPCEGVDWITSDWSDCKTCQSRVKTRTAYCASKENRVYNNTFCAHHQMPKLQEDCEPKDLLECNFQWYASQWSSCSAQCGPGEQRRQVFCAMLSGTDLSKVNDELCDPAQRYNDTRPCSNEKDTCSAAWHVGPWTKCPENCGTGTQTRDYWCIRDGKVADEQYCDQNYIPDREQACNQQSCNEDEVMSEKPGTLQPSFEDDYDECPEEEEAKFPEEGVESEDGATPVSTDASSTSDDLVSTYTDEGYMSDSPSSSDSTEGSGFDLSSTYAASDMTTGSGDGELGTAFTSSSESTDLTLNSEKTDTTASENNNATTDGGSTISSVATESETTEKATDVSSSSGSTESEATETASDVSTSLGLSKSTSDSILSTGVSESESKNQTEVTIESTTEPIVTTQKIQKGGDIGIVEQGAYDPERDNDKDEIIVPSTNTSKVTTESNTKVTSNESTETTDNLTTESSSDFSTTVLLTDESSIDVSTTEVSSSSKETRTDVSGSTETEASTGSSSENTVLSSEPTSESSTTEGSSSSESTVLSSEPTSESSTTEGNTMDASTKAKETENTTEPGGTTESSSTSESTATISNLTTELDLTTDSDSTIDLSTLGSDITSQSEISTESSSTSELNVTSITESSSESEVSTESVSTIVSGITSVSDSASDSDISTESGGSSVSDSTTESQISKETDSTTESGSTSESISSSVSENSTESITTVESSSTEEPSSSTEAGSTTESGSSTESGSTTESGSSTDSGSSIESESTTELGTSTESGSTTEPGSTTETGSTTESGTSTDSLSTTEESTIWTTDNDETSSWIWSSTDGGTSKKPKCRPRSPKSKCISSTFGCCPDGKTSATGPFEDGCDHPAETCAKSAHGCCPDGVSPAQGPGGAGCPSSHCNETLFGCCASDGQTPAQGNDQEGCPPPPPPCEKSKFGCCKDEKTEATGPKGEGCPENAPTPEPPKTCFESEHGCCYDNVTQAPGPKGEGCPCNATQHRCCPDHVTAAQGPNMQGCVKSCNDTTYGCCQDNETPAHGRLGEGCCLSSSFGCCPDNINRAIGPHFEGCGCQFSPYGCCPDNVTSAKGYSNEGCGCKHTPHGCCPDRYTPALGPNFEGCKCFTYQFGCCPDGETPAKGPQQAGCRCGDTEFGCCGDGQTAARGANGTGCDCASSKYGCCPDGRTAAQGEKFLNCTDKLESRQASCGLDKERGPCNNYTVRWFYDTEYGGCSRFWYGGCEGNGNRFVSVQECQDVCVKPTGKDACLLPKTKGVCGDYHPRWYYDSEREVCGQFVYGGCLGNKNNFETREECQGLCEEPKSKDQCALPVEAGSCAGNFVRWAFDGKRCSQFVWGGCEGNANRFASESACIQQCDAPGTLKDECRLPREVGNCTEKLPKWVFDQGENRCMPFYYTGCNGNDNQFDSERECENRCPQIVVQDTCTLPAVTGDCSEYTPRYYYDTADESCRPFYYGGCNGNGNNFRTQDECQRRCADTPTTTLAPVTAEPFRSDFCFLQPERGPCDRSEPRYHYDPRTGSCQQFLYGGCGGNQNNFPTLEHCHSYCSSVQDICQLPMLVGPCEESQMQWYYDAHSDTCSQFAYSGCQGNPNRFNSREECEGRCRTTPVTTSTTSRSVLVPDIDSRGPVLEECRQPASLEPCGREQEAWYYDESRRSCTQTLSGACQRHNNYASEEACERRCGVFRDLEVCRYPVDPGLCRESLVKFYFDEESSHCFEFVYGGCGGGPNRFSSIEECRQVCGAREPDTVQIPIDDVCRMPMDTGRCAPEQFSPSRRWFFSDEAAECQVFVYEGCGGNQNNFRSYDECKLYCGKEIENNTIPEPCDEYDAECERLRCEYGVGRTKTPEGCERCVCRDDPCARTQCPRDEVCTAQRVGDQWRPVCGPVENNTIPEPCDGYDAECERLRCQYGVGRTKTPEGCERCVCREDPCARTQCPGDEVCTREKVDDQWQPVCGPGNEVIQRCDTYRAECENLSCDFGVERRRTQDDCEKCVCAHPCSTLTCGDGDRCTVTYTAENKPKPVCRTSNKPGTCPYFNEEPESGDRCARECNDDADCEGGDKCCQRGCHLVCAPSRELTTQRPYTRPPYTPAPTAEPYDPRAGQPAAPQVDPVSPSEVNTQEGDLATLRCVFSGYPAPTITWQRGELTIDSTSGHYRILTDGALQIVSVYRNDSGVYVCIGSNGVGEPARKEVNLDVRDDPVPIAAGIAGDENASVTGTLHQPLLLRCAAFGYPSPDVFWWKGSIMLPFQSQYYEINRDRGLIIRSLEVDTLGVYTCQAFNGVGKPASWSVTVRAYRTDDSVSSPWLVARDDQVEEPRTRPPATRPPPTLPVDDIDPNIIPGEYFPPVYNVPVLTSIPADRTTYPAGSELSLPCLVEGHPLPRVYWSKDGQPIEPSDRVQVSEAYRLTIVGVQTNDSGVYTCHASNDYSSHSSYVQINVEGLYLHPNCTDNPFFANCQLIVKGQYCRHQYYAQFCCRSCTLAGQLSSQDMLADQPKFRAWKRK